jgi:hypothetical protein
MLEQYTATKVYIYRRKSLDHLAIHCDSSSIKKGIFYFFKFTLLIHASSAAPQMTLCRRMLRSKQKITRSFDHMFQLHALHQCHVWNKKNGSVALKVIAVQIQIQTGPEDHLNEFGFWISSTHFFLDGSVV